MNAVAESLMDEPFFVAVSRSHPLASLDIVRFVDLKDVPLISMPSEMAMRKTIDETAAKSGVTLDHSFMTRQYNSLFGFVDAGL